MIDAQLRDTICALHQSGEGIRSIARKLSIDRKTVKRIVNPKDDTVSVRKNRIEVDEELLRRLFAECNGWMQRVHEKLTEEHSISIAYSTLTQRCRELGLSERIKKANKRFHHVETDPGEEMQHDTSPYTVALNGVPTKVIASVIYLRYSKMKYLRFYLHFRRYDMKCFLHEALQYFGYSAQRCIIDNTNLARLRGVGYSAEIQHQMDAFARRYGFEFICHEIGHSNRKAGNERAFWTTETNFLPGRTFRDLSDLNAKAFEWATVRMAQKPHSKTKVIPAEAFESEKPYLTPVSPQLICPVKSYGRTIDPYGYTEIDTNFYWVPGKDRVPVTVIEHQNRIDITRNRTILISYPKPAQDVRKKIVKPKGVDTRPVHLRRERATKMEEDELKLMPDPVPAYLDYLLKEAKGVRKSNMIRAIHRLSREVSTDLFVKTMGRALKYCISDMSVIENIADMILRTEGQALPQCTIDPNLKNRPEYQDGCTSQAPDLSTYDKHLLEDQ